jgi:hypothetical protein
VELPRDVWTAWDTPIISSRTGQRPSGPGGVQLLCGTTAGLAVRRVQARCVVGVRVCATCDACMHVWYVHVRYICVCLCVSVCVCVRVICLYTWGLCV